MKLASTLPLAVSAALGAAGVLDALAAGWEVVNVALSTCGVGCLAGWTVMSHRGRARAGLVIVSVLGALAGVELTIRALSLEGWVSEPYVPEASQTFHHNYRPGDRFVRRPTPPDDFEPVENVINSLGMRGAESDVDRAQVMLIGDSFIQADEVEYEKTIGRVLERRLQATGDQVVSHGMGSWAPVLEWNWYLKVGRRFQPRVVFLFVFHNDVDPGYDKLSDPYYLRQATFGPDGRPERFDIGAPASPAHRALRRLRMAIFWRLARERLRGALLAIEADQGRAGPNRERPGLRSEEVDVLLDAPQEVFERQLAALGLAPATEGFWRLQRPLHLWPPQLLRNVELSEPVLRRFSEDVRADGGRLVLVFVPMGFQVGPSECSAARAMYGLAPDAQVRPRSGLQQWLEATARRHDIPWLDPTEGLRSAGLDAGTPSYLSYDCHWSERGHARMAEILAEWLETAGA